MPKYPEFKSKPIIGLPEEDWGKLTAGHFNRIINTDWEAASAKRIANTNFKERNNNIDYKAFQEKRIANTDFKSKAANTDYKAIVAKVNQKEKAKKLMKSVSQFDLQGNWIKDWESITQVSKELNFEFSSISMCCRGKLKKSQGFIWKFKQENP